MAESTPVVNTTVSEQISSDGIPTGVPATIAPPTSAPGIKLPDHTNDPPPLVTEVSEAPSRQELPNSEEREIPESDDTIDFSKFLEAKGETPKKEEPKVEVKPTPSLETTPPQRERKPRDYSGIDEADVLAFKRMSGEAFDRMKPIYLEHKKIKNDLASKEKELTELKNTPKPANGVPDSYYEHPQAFILTPEFAGGLQNVQKGQFIYNFWRQQLRKVREGAEEYEHLDINPQTGQFYTTKIKASPESEDELESYINHSQSQLSNVQSNLARIQGEHNSKFQNAIQWVNNMENNSYSIFNKPGYEHLNTLVEDTVRGFPPAFKNSPLSRMLAKSMIMNVQLGRLLQAIDAQQKNGSGKNDDKRKAGPSTKDIAADGKSGDGDSSDEITFDAFQRAKM